MTKTQTQKLYSLAITLLLISLVTVANSSTSKGEEKLVNHERWINNEKSDSLSSDAIKSQSTSSTRNYIKIQVKNKQVGRLNDLLQKRLLQPDSCTPQQVANCHICPTPASPVDPYVCQYCQVGYFLDPTPGADPQCKACSAGNGVAFPQCTSCDFVTQDQGPALQCELCSDSFYLKSSDKTCAACTVTDCNKCQEDTGVQKCIQCTDTKYLDSAQACQTCADSTTFAQCIDCVDYQSVKTCGNCADGFYPDGVNGCGTCPSNCATCQSATLCSTCSQGYKLSSDQSICELCSADGGAYANCNVCYSLFSPYSVQCGKCNTPSYLPRKDQLGCQLCSDSTTKIANCLNCKTDGYLDQCSKCNLKYLLTVATYDLCTLCVAANVDPKCTTCSTDGIQNNFCIKCNANFLPAAADQKSCVACGNIITSCMQCHTVLAPAEDAIGTDVCTYCGDQEQTVVASKKFVKYVLVASVITSSSCEACGTVINGCTTCNSGSKTGVITCTLCNDGFVLYQDGSKCQPCESVTAGCTKCTGLWTASNGLAAKCVECSASAGGALRYPSFDTPTHQCKECSAIIPSCGTCDTANSDTTCRACTGSWAFLNRLACGTCTQSITYCSTCVAATSSSETTTCTACLSSAYLVNPIRCKLCTSVNSNCLRCVQKTGQNKGVCTRCTSGQIPSSDAFQCKSCSSIVAESCTKCRDVAASDNAQPPATQSARNLQCTQCQGTTNYPRVDLKTCLPCNRAIYKCVTCQVFTPASSDGVFGSGESVGTKCTACSNGFQPDTNGRKCIPIPPPA